MAHRGGLHALIETSTPNAPIIAHPALVTGQTT